MVGRDKVVLFCKLEESKYLRFISSNQVEMSLRQDALVLMMFASQKVESKAKVVNLDVACEFLDVFSNDIGDLPPDRKVEFMIDLAPSNRSISMALCIMSAS